MSEIRSQDRIVKTNTDGSEQGEYSGGDRPVRSWVGKMAPTGMKFDLVKFDGSGNFGLW
jgi:hypothetical protein